MASEIVRDGVTYSVAKTFEFDESGNCIEYEGGEITEAEIDEILKQEREAQEIEALAEQAAIQDYEVHHLTPEEKKALKKAKSLI